LNTKTSLVKRQNKKISPSCVEQLPISGRISFETEYIIQTSDVAYLTHTIHKYPSKFIPQIPKWAIRRYLSSKSNSYVFDPMCGSGTTLLEAKLHNQNSIGMDIDPLACLISKVKITSLDRHQLKVVNDNVKKKILRQKKGKFHPPIDCLEHWFTNKNINQLSIIRDTIELYSDENDIYDFLIIVFSSILRKVSNADDQSQKTYVSHTNPKVSQEAIPLFLKKLRKYSERIAEVSNLQSNTKHFIYNEDTRLSDSIIKKIFGYSIDLAITSPPYIKALDYIYTNMLEYFWIGDVFGLENRTKQNMYKRKYIGTKQVYVHEYNTKIETGNSSIDSICDKVTRKNQKFGYITSRFFQDILTNLKNIHTILKPKSHYILVVGNCSVAGIPVNVNDLVCDLAKQVGFSIDNVFSYLIQNRYMRFPRLGRGGLITHDWVIDLKK